MRLPIYSKKITCFLSCLFFATAMFGQSSGSGINGFVYAEDNQPFESATCECKKFFNRFQHFNFESMFG
ncbi:MAG: hypothetical protein ABI707_15570 [Ferruginibacter sp.]